MAYAAEPVGFLAGCIQLIREFTAEPVDDAVFSAERLYPRVRSAYRSAMREVLNVADNKVRVRFDIAVNTTTSHYMIPANVGQVLRLAKAFDYDATRYYDWRMPNNELSSWGSSWGIEGPYLRLSPLPQTAETITMIYAPNGDSAIHLGSVAADDADNSTSTWQLAVSPAEGYFDRRPNAMLGCTLRVLSSSGTAPAGYAYFPVQERVITAVSAAAVATVTPAFDFNPATLTGQTATYEVVPFLGDQLQRLVSLHVARDIRRSVRDEAHARSLDRLYAEEMRNIRLWLSQVQARTGDSFSSDVPTFGIAGQILT